MESINHFFTGTFLLAILTYLGYQLRSVPNLIWQQIKKRLIYSVYIEETSELFSYFENYLIQYHEKSFKNVKASLSNDFSRNELPREKSTDEKLKLQHYSDTFFMRFLGKKLLITKGREKLENASDIRSAFFNHFKIDGWLCKAEITELLSQVIKYNQHLKKKTQTIYTNDSYGSWLNFGEVCGKNIDSIFLKEKYDIIDNIDDFISKEKWYLERGMSYRRGYLLYGEPGNGKTSLCLAIAQYFNRDIHFINLNDIEKDNNLFICFNGIKNNSILVIEDVDAIFGTRDGKSKISFSALLNCLDGAFSKYGVITIMTTNHINKIDDALIREGRIDMKIKVDNPDKQMVEEYLSKFYGYDVILKKYEPVLSMSKIQEVCLQHKNNLRAAISILSPMKQINVIAHLQ